MPAGPQSSGQNTRREDGTRARSHLARKCDELCFLEASHVLSKSEKRALGFSARGAAAFTPTKGPATAPSCGHVSPAASPGGSSRGSFPCDASKRSGRRTGGSRVNCDSSGFRTAGTYSPQKRVRAETRKPSYGSTSAEGSEAEKRSKWLAFPPTGLRCLGSRMLLLVLMGWTEI